MHWISQQKTAAFCLASLMAIAPAAMKQNSSAAQANPLMPDASDHPLDLTLGELDGSWREFRISGQYEFADLIQTWFSLFGISNVYSNTYFTQGNTIDIAGKQYLVAYRFPLAPQELNLEDMFSVWDTGQGCEDMAMLESELVNLDTTINLSLLNPNTIGSLNDIQTLDVAELIEQSKERYDMMQERCQEAEAESKVTEAVQNLGAMNRAQQAFWLENETFTSDISELQIGVSEDTEYYSYYLTSENAKLVTSQAVAKSPSGHHIVGGVYALESEVELGYPTTVSILCKKSEKGGQIPDEPYFDESWQTLACPLGTTQTY
ncbi:type IV pilin-like G/H family protein [[Leptolyngbya] sp. PCC 7376]|uniref:type IV pilin-like G/H family protein n=1 Tax=[Leptolyngbya] sp. PCC 7376 TaxID=111781 RepID=UPI0003100D7F|nr:type IV pilin-like G/H family protein [[Leptolyngbya] sp. PCC 7376]